MEKGVRLDITTNTSSKSIKELVIGIQNLQNQSAIWCTRTLFHNLDATACAFMIAAFCCYGVQRIVKDITTNKKETKRTMLFAWGHFFLLFLGRSRVFLWSVRVVSV